MVTRAKVIIIIAITLAISSLLGYFLIKSNESKTIQPIHFDFYLADKEE